MSEDPATNLGGAARLGRRTVLRGSLLGGAGLATAALIGCGGDDNNDSDNGSSSGGGGGTSAATGVLKTTSKRPDQLPAGWVWDPNLPFPTDYPEPDKTSKPGGTFAIATSWDVGPFDPVSAAAGGSIVIPNEVYNRLIGFKVGPGVDKTKLELVPELAQSWERSPDGLTVTFKIDPRAKWQNVAPLNGRQFVAADAKYTFERYQKEGVYKSYWANAASLEAPDASTFKVTLSKPIVDFLYPLGGRYQTVFPHETVDDGSITKTVVGTGPWILKEAIPSQRVRLDKNPDYWELPLMLDATEFRPMPDASARLAAFRAGQVDYAYSIVDTKRAIDELIKTNPDVQVTMVSGSSNSGGMPMLNLNNPRWQDVRVRRALSLGTDRKAISDVIFEGLGQSLSVLPWLHALDTQPTIESGGLGNWVRHAPDEAKQLLQAAGQTSMTVDAAYYEYAAAYTQTAELMSDQLRQVGITYNPRKLDYTEFNSQLVGGTFPDVLHDGYVLLGFDADTFYYNGLYSKSPGNRDHVNDPDIDTWAQAQQVELDPAKRKELLKKIWDKYNDQVYRPLSTIGRSFDVLQPWIRGLRFGGALGSGSFYYDWGRLTLKTWIDK
jgi:peptide/nickel transport system substrate-binding protein